MAFGKKYTSTNVNLHNTHTYLLEIWVDGWGDSSSEIDNNLNPPFVLSYPGDDNFDTIIFGSELIFSFIASKSQLSIYDEFLTSNWATIIGVLKRDNTTIWQGYLQSANSQREFFGNEYNYRLSFVDGLAYLKHVDYQDTANNGPWIDRTNLLTVLKRCLAPLGFNLDFKIQLNTYENLLMAASDCTLDKCTIDNRIFFSNTDGTFKYDTCYDVIEKILTPFYCTLFVDSNSYYIINKLEYNSYIYTFDWSTLTKQSRLSSDLSVNIYSDEFLDNGLLQKITPVKLFNVTNKNKYVLESVILNPDFSAGTNNWTKGSGTAAWYSFTTNDGALRTTSLDNYLKTYISDAFSLTVGTDNQFRVTWWAKVNSKSPGGASYPLTYLVLAGPGGYSVTGDKFTLTSDWVQYTNIFALDDSNTGSYTVTAYSEPQGGTALTQLTIDWDNFQTQLITDYTQVYDYLFQGFLDVFDTSRVDKIDKEIYLTDGSAFYASALKVSTDYTSRWNLYGRTDNIIFTETYLEQLLVDRQSYKNLVTWNIADISDAIYKRNFLNYNSVYHFITSFKKDFYNEQIEIIATEVNNSFVSFYDWIFRKNSSEGVSGNTIVAGTGLMGGGTFNELNNSITLSLDTTSPAFVDHSAVSIIAGAGLSGGGDITASRTLSIDTSWLLTNFLNISSLADGTGVGNSNSKIEIGNGPLGSDVHDLSLYAGVGGSILLYTDGTYMGQFQSSGLKLLDNYNLILGTGSDVTLKFDGTDTIFTYGGDLIFKSGVLTTFEFMSTGDLLTGITGAHIGNSSAYIEIGNGAMNDNSHDLALYAGTGGILNLYAGTARIGFFASTALKLFDNIKILLGDGADTEIYHDGSNTIINQAGTGDVLIKDGGITKFTFNVSTVNTGIGTATDWIATSDRRLKNDLGEFIPDKIELKKLRKLLRRFTWKDNKREDLGIYAQDIEKVAPGLSKYLIKTDNKGIKAVNYIKLALILAL